MMADAPEPLARSCSLLAVVPAICEEVAFRGFILSGLERGVSRPGRPSSCRRSCSGSCTSC